LHAIGAENVYCFADNNKAGEALAGKRIISFVELKDIATEYNIMISVGWDAMFMEIASQLKAGHICFEVFNPYRTLIECGEFLQVEKEGAFTKEFVRFIKDEKPKSFANIGAERGGYASIAAHFMAKDSDIYLFEPIPIFADKLAGMFLNDKRVHVINKAVSNTAGALELHTVLKPDQSGIAHSFTIDAEQTMFKDQFSDEYRTVTHTAEMVAIDDYLGDKDIDLVLMDIEGAEVLAFEGMEKLIAKRKTTFFLEVHTSYMEAIRPGGIQYINELFKKYNYEIQWCQYDKNDYAGTRGGTQLIPVSDIQFEHCVMRPR